MLINIHTHHLAKDENSTLNILNQYPWDFHLNQSFYSIGIHPIFITDSSIEKDLSKIEHKLSDQKCLAIGEIGLDKLCAVDFDLQITVFKRQLEIAKKYNTPLIIHCVRAHQEILKIQKDMKYTMPFIFHGFNKNDNVAQQLIKNKCKLSFGKDLLHNKKLQTIFAEISENDFFLENDNSQVPIEEIYHKAAEIRNTSVKVISQITQCNFKTIFGNNII